MVRQYQQGVLLREGEGGCEGGRGTHANEAETDLSQLVVGQEVEVLDGSDEEEGAGDQDVADGGDDLGLDVGVHQPTPYRCCKHVRNTHRYKKKT